MGAELGCLWLGTTYTRQFGLGLEKTWEGAKTCAAHLRINCLLTLMFCGILIYLCLNSRCQARAGVLGGSDRSAACHTPVSGTSGSTTPALPHVPPAEAPMDAPARETSKPSPDLARRVHVGQDFDRQQKIKQDPSPPNPYKHLPSVVSVWKTKIRCKDEGNIPLVIPHTFCLHSRDSQLYKGKQ